VGGALGGLPVNHARRRYTYLAVLLVVSAITAAIGISVRSSMMSARIEELETTLLNGRDDAAQAARELASYKSGSGLWRVAYYRGVEIRSPSPKERRLIDSMWRTIGERGINDLIKCVRGDSYVMWCLGIDNATTGGTSGKDNPGGARRGLSFGAAEGLAVIGKPAVKPLIEALRTGDAVARGAAIYALRRIDDDRARAALPPNVRSRFPVPVASVDSSSVSSF